MLRKYGIGAAAYDSMIEAQDGKCAICMRPVQLVVDHCHTSGAVRGLLCGSCNTAIGMFEEQIDSLTNAIAYLERANQ